MSWRDAVGLSLAGLRRRPGRAVLTVLAVTLASALLTSLLTIARTAETRVLTELADGGPLTGITVEARQANLSQLSQDVPAAGGDLALDDEAVAAIAGLDAVEQVLPLVVQDVFVIEPTDPDPDDDDPTGGAFQERLVGVDLAQPGLLPVSVLAGRLPAPGATGEVAVGVGWLERFGIDPDTPAEALDTEVVLAAGRRTASRREVTGRWLRARVVGVVAQEVGPGQLFGSIELAQASRDWTIGGIDDGASLGATASPYSGLYVVADGLDAIGPTRAAIADIGYSTRAPENLIESVQRYLRVVAIVLAGIGLIALAVAALGVANALLAAVAERRREIGVLKAIGARDRDVLRVFLLEASGVGVLGGLAGALLGWLAARAVGEVVNRALVGEGLRPVALEAPVAILVASVVGTTLLAVAAGTIPARRAARLSAHDAVQGA